MNNPCADYKDKSSLYWDSDPQLKLLGLFKSLYSEDKTKGKKDSSLTMWAIAFFCHPKSRMINYDSEEREKLIETDIVGKKLNWDKLDELVDAYKKLYLTEAQRSLVDWELKLEERRKFLLSVKYSDLELSEVEKLDKVLANTPKLFTEYQTVLAQVNEEKSKGINKAGIKESASEKGTI